MTAIERLTEHAPPKAALDTTKPVLPETVRDPEAAVTATKLAARRGWYRAKRFVVGLPVLAWILLKYSPVGFGRAVKALAKWAYDWDGAEIRAQHARSFETKEYQAADRIHAQHMRARWMVLATFGTILVGPILCWFAPWWLGGIVGFLLFWWICKIIPGKNPMEYVVGAVIGAVAGWQLPIHVFPLLPVPPGWVWPVLAVVLIVGFGWYGRPAEAPPLLKREDPAAAGLPEKPSAPVVIDALCRLGIPGLSEKTRDDIRVFAPGVARSKRGYHLQMELPPGVTAAAVMELREEFAAALRRELGTIWPRKGDRHPGHLVLFISDNPMATAPQAAWPVAEGKVLDFFSPIPHFTDQEGQWTDLTLAYNQMIVGGAPGYGKSYAVRQLGVAVAFDPRVRIVCLDGKGNGDLRPLRLVAHGFYEGDEDEDIAEQLAAVKAIREEMRRRAKFLRELPREENPQNKATSELVDKYPDLAPIVLLVDEAQVYTEHDDKTVRDEFVRVFTDLVKRGRSAGVTPIFCTQKPDAKVLPTGISDNCSVRLCFRVNGWKSNDQVLGSEAHKTGIKATLFSAQDKGLAWLKGDGAEPQVVRTVYGLDQVEAEELMLKAREIRERRGLLSGYAAGEEAEREEIQADLLADCRDVMDHPPVKAMHLVALVERLELLRPGIWGHLDADALGSMLRAAGVRVGQVKAEGRNTSGVRREWLDVAATSDEDPDDEGGNVVAIG